jgi:hypothetical protein
MYGLMHQPHSSHAKTKEDDYKGDVSQRLQFDHLVTVNQVMGETVTNERAEI